MLEVQREPRQQAQAWSARHKLIRVWKESIEIPDAVLISAVSGISMLAEWPGVSASKRYIVIIYAVVAVRLFDIF
jgi:hypothetical protein